MVMKSRQPDVAMAVGVCVVATAVIMWTIYRRKKNQLPQFQMPTEWEELGEVSELHIHPVKSARNIPVSEAEATLRGLRSGNLEDRSFLVVTEAESRFVTIRQEPKLAIVVTKVSGSTLTLEADGCEAVHVNMKTVIQNGIVVQSRVWNVDVVGQDCGEDVSQWLTQAVNGGKEKLRLIYKGTVLEDKPARPIIYFHFPHQKKTDTAYFADTSPYMIANENSLSDLNSHLDEAETVSMQWFRPNIVITGPPAWDEDDWHYIKIDNVILRRIKPCERCMLITVSPENGIKHPELKPLSTLKKYRCPKEPPTLAKVWKEKPIFGNHMGLEVPGTIKVGAKVLVARASNNPHWQYPNV